MDIPETGNTLEENALQKAQYVYDHYHVSCFADDTGLEVEALDGAPGVHSARYAEGTDHDSEANMAKLLRELDGKENRQARFRTVICYIEKQDVCPCGCTSIKKIHQFEGIVNGHIATEKHGTEGFGYDPIFVPEGYDKSFAELGEEIKNGISHRARAVAKLVEYLKRNKMINSLSILIPTYNNVCFELVKTLQAQAALLSDFEYEILVADDGSTDLSTITGNRKSMR